MNLEKQPRQTPRWAIPLALFVAFVVVAKLLNTNPPTNRAETTPDHDEEAMRTRFYGVSLPSAISKTQEILRAQTTYGQPWKITSYDATQGDRQHIHAEVPVLVFTDDFTVKMSHESDGYTRVDCQSASRLGKGDFGENRRHIVQFLAALDKELKKR